MYLSPNSSGKIVVGIACGRNLSAKGSDGDVLQNPCRKNQNICNFKSPLNLD